MPASPPARSARRLLAVLDAFDRSTPGLTLTGIGERAGLPLTTTHRLVGVLAEWGALERDESGAYRIGPHLREIAALAPHGTGLRRAAMPFLEDLCAATGEDVDLAVRDGLEAVSVAQVAGRSAAGTRVGRDGARRPLHATGAGLVLLAYGPAEVQEEVCAGELPGSAHRTAPALLRRTLAEIRRTGRAVGGPPAADDARWVAWPVRGPEGEVVAAVAVVVRGREPRRSPLPVAAVYVTARGISRALGGQPEDAS